MGMGINLVSIDEPNIDSSAAGKSSVNLLGSFNQFFSDSLSEKTKFRMAVGVKAGKWLWKAPLGYLNHDKRVVIDPVRGALVRKAFELIPEVGYQDAFRIVKSMGLTTRTGRTVSKQTFTRLVRNEFYAGYVVSNDVRVKGNHDPLISEELFATVQGKLNGGQPHQKDHEDFPLRR
jgi:site-specific DNA recombinase